MKSLKIYAPFAQTLKGFKMKPEGTLQQKVWDYIRRNPNFRVGDILMIIPMSKTGLRRYLIALRKAKYIRKNNIKKQGRGVENDSYTLIQKVGVYAPKINKKALFDPNTKATYSIADGEIQNVRDGSYVHYSKLLGRPEKFMSNYKHLNPHLLTAEECYLDYVKKQKSISKTVQKIQKIYSFLTKKEELFVFGKYLRDKGLFTAKYSFISTMKNAHKERVHNFQSRVLNKCETIVKEFEALYGAVDTLEEKA